MQSVPLVKTPALGIISPRISASAHLLQSNFAPRRCLLYSGESFGGEKHASYLWPPKDKIHSVVCLPAVALLKTCLSAQ